MVTLQELESRVVELERGQQNAFILNKVYASPARVYEGMLAYADGTTWNPGSGLGLYQYRGGSWTFIA